MINNKLDENININNTNKNNDNSNKKIIENNNFKINSKLNKKKIDFLKDDSFNPKLNKFLNTKERIFGRNLSLNNNQKDIFTQNLSKIIKSQKNGEKILNILNEKNKTKDYYKPKNLIYFDFLIKTTSALNNNNNNSNKNNLNTKDNVSYIFNSNNNNNKNINNNNSSLPLIKKSKLLIKNFSSDIFNIKPIYDIKQKKINKDLKEKSSEKYLFKNIQNNFKKKINITSESNSNWKPKDLGTSYINFSNLKYNIISPGRRINNIKILEKKLNKVKSISEFEKFSKINYSPYRKDFIDNLNNKIGFKKINNLCYDQCNSIKNYKGLVDEKGNYLKF